MSTKKNELPTEKNELPTEKNELPTKPEKLEKTNISKSELDFEISDEELERIAGGLAQTTPSGVMMC
jgi:hypothetical protein